MQQTLVRSLGEEDPLEEEMATHSSILAWRIPGTEEPVHGVAKELDTTERLNNSHHQGLGDSVCPLSWVFSLLLLSLSSLSCCCITGVVATLGFVLNKVWSGLVMFCHAAGIWSDRSLCPSSMNMAMC